MRLLAAITEPSVARRILECLSLPPRAPPLAPAAAIDRKAAIGRIVCEPTLAEAHDDPDFDFDQSPAEGRCSNEGA